MADRRIFPAIDITASATRREELLLSDEALTLSRALRRQFAGSNSSDVMSELISVMKRTTNNAELLELSRAGRTPG